MLHSVSTLSGTNLATQHFSPVSHDSMTALTHGLEATRLGTLYGFDQKVCVIHFEQMRLITLQIMTQTLTSTHDIGQIMLGIIIPMPAQTQFVKRCVIRIAVQVCSICHHMLPAGKMEHDALLKISRPGLIPGRKAW